MIKQIWFDFGNIFIPIYPERTRKAFDARGVQLTEEGLKALNERYEVGALSTQEFLQDIATTCSHLQSSMAVAHGWNALLGKLQDRTLFLKKLVRTYELCLVSNTNEAHIKHIKKESGPFLWNAFVEKFEALFLSYEIGHRKPDRSYFEYVLKHMDAKPEEVLFIDDSSVNIEAAAALGIHTWQFNAQEGNITRELPPVLAKLNQRTTSTLGV
jgi:HAD superfamily hydrolase (TIGR01509 family)